MSTKYPGGFITKDYVAPTPSSAKGVWTLDQQMQAQKAGTWPFGGPFNYIEDVFSTYLYTGNGATQTITNGIDLAGKGGLVWIKNRTGGPYDHMLLDTARGTSKYLNSNTTAAESTNAFQLTSFNSNGFTLGDGNFTNNSAATYASWTFRKQPKFFDIVTYTGNGTAGHQISHSLGSVPGMVIVKGTTTAYDWYVWHRSLTAGNNIKLNSTAAASSGSEIITGTSSTTFTVNQYGGGNQAGETYVAYIYAHNAGGFGGTGTDNVITCGNYTGVAYPNSQEVSLGFEPQWVMIKNTTTASGWSMWDVVRGMVVVPAANVAQAQLLEPNTADAESTQPGIYPTATGFVVKNGLTAISGLGDNFIYVAIRRGPMRVPTDGTTVFNALARTGNDVVTKSSLTFTPDVLFSTNRTKTSGSTLTYAMNRLNTTRGGVMNYLGTNVTDAEASYSPAYVKFDVSDGIWFDAYNNPFFNNSPLTYINWLFKRAPGFMDVVCYTGTGVVATYAHNLGVVPELMIFKIRSGARRWPVYTQPTGNTQALVLNVSDAVNSTGNNYFNSTSPTSTVFTVNGSFGDIGDIGNTFVAYLFATCPGVSKVGSYTGTGATQTINCGFTAGARFVLIKRTDSTGDWYVWDTARGMVSGTDPSLLLNSTAAEVNADSVYAITTGFQIVSTAAGINASGGSYIFLAIA